MSGDCQHSWKIVRYTCPFIIILQSRRQGPKYYNLASTDTYHKFVEFSHTSHSKQRHHCLGRRCPLRMAVCCPLLRRQHCAAARQPYRGRLSLRAAKPLIQTRLHNLLMTIVDICIFVLCISAQDTIEELLLKPLQPSSIQLRSTSPTQSWDSRQASAAVPLMKQSVHSLNYV